MPLYGSAILSWRRMMYSVSEPDTLNIYIYFFFINKNEIFMHVLILLSFIILMDVCLFGAVWKTFSSLFKWGENKSMLCTLINSFNSQSDSKVHWSHPDPKYSWARWPKTTKSCIEVKRNKWFFTFWECQKDRKMTQHMMSFYCAIGMGICSLSWR